MGAAVGWRKKLADNKSVSLSSQGGSLACGVNVRQGQGKARESGSSLLWDPGGALPLSGPLAELSATWCWEAAGLCSQEPASLEAGERP